MTALITRPLRLTAPSIFPWPILLMILATVAAIIWGTLGLHTTAIYEDWLVYNAFLQGRAR